MIASAVRVVGAMRSEPTTGAVHFTGLVRVTSKSALTSNEWLQFLQTAKSEFYVAGHSLGKWCSASNREDFKNHLRRILDSNGRVTLVMLDPASPQIARLQLATPSTIRAGLIPACMCSRICATCSDPQPGIA